MNLATFELSQHKQNSVHFRDWGRVLRETLEGWGEGKIHFLVKKKQDNTASMSAYTQT